MDFLYDTNIVVLIAFLIFVGILLLAKVPGRLAGMLDDRAEKIRIELNEARELREEAQKMLAPYERQQKDVQREAEDIVAKAREDAAYQAEKAKADLKDNIARRLKGAEEQIKAAEDDAVRSVRNRAAEVAVEATREILAGKLPGDKSDALINDAIGQVGSKLH